MIVDIENTTTSKVSKRLAELREDGGVVALTRVLTLVVLTRRENAEDAIAAANLASREHPCRVIVLADGDADAETRLDAQIRVGGDAGASEVIILFASGELTEPSEAMISGLLLPDAPIVAWWVDQLPEQVSRTPIGSIAHRRITDILTSDHPLEALEQLSRTYTDGDSDFSWTRLTGWRIQLASILDTLDAEQITSVTVETALELPSAALLAAWLRDALDRPVELEPQTHSPGLSAVRFHLPEGDVVLQRPDGSLAELHPVDGPVQRVPLPLRTLQDCLTEELRRLDADEIFGEVLTSGIPRTDLSACTRTSA